MSREIEFEESTICDNCKKKGAYDFMGDNLCEECAFPEKKELNKEQFINWLVPYIVELAREEINQLDGKGWRSTKEEILAKVWEEINGKV
mgnify:CR=1 FL=1